MAVKPTSLDNGNNGNNVQPTPLDDVNNVRTTSLNNVNKNVNSNFNGNKNNNGKNINKQKSGNVGRTKESRNEDEGQLLACIWAYTSCSSSPR